MGCIWPTEIVNPMTMKWVALQALDADTPAERAIRLAYIVVGAFFAARGVVGASGGHLEELFGWLTIGLPFAGIGFIGLPFVRRALEKLVVPSVPRQLERRWRAHPESVARSLVAWSGAICGILAALLSLRIHPFSGSVLLVLLMSALVAGLAVFHWLVADPAVRSELVR